MASWFLTFSSDKAKDNANEWAWQNPIYMIEAGWTQIITGFRDEDNIDDDKISIGDTFYIYGGGEEFRDDDKNGLWAIGKVIDSLNPEFKRKKGFVVMLDKTNAGKPLVECVSENVDFYRNLCLKANHKMGWLKLSTEQIEQLEKDIEESEKS